jgi:hypothetical protein
MVMEPDEEPEEDRLLTPVGLIADATTFVPLL